MTRSMDCETSHTTKLAHWRMFRAGGGGVLGGQIARGQIAANACFKARATNTLARWVLYSTEP